MKILLSSHFFPPSVGGIETVSEILAREFAHAGHEVQVVTQTAEEDGARFPFSVHRRPSAAALLRLVAWCDACFHNNISLRTAWPLLFLRRPWVVAHHMWIARVDGTIGWRDRLKQSVVRRARNIVVSEALRAQIAAPAVVIGNPYRDDIFRRDPNAARDRELVCMGRLLPDKGVDLLFQALATLRARKLTPNLTVVGTGPEERALRELSAKLGIESQVTFAGKIVGADLAAVLNRHRVIVVPSRYPETFGLAALEGLACGCLPLVTDCGGLPEAVGKAGAIFHSGDAEDAAAWIEKLLDPNADLHACREAAEAHLAAHTARAVAEKYLHVIEEAARL
jgi:glycosyltransferase involved in cell wall biosynthesis